MKHTLKTRLWLPLVAAGLTLCMGSAYAQTTIAQWTFETLPSNLSYNPGLGLPTTNYLAEGGTQAGVATASGKHFGGYGTATYSSPAGNGSARSFSSNGWTNNPGDYYQFVVNTVSFTNIGISFDQISSGTGPGQFYVAYSTDGINFTQYGSIYTVLSSPSWSAGTPQTAESYAFSLSSIAELANNPAVYIRLVNASMVSASGGTIGTGGTCRIDNVVIFGTIAGPPQIVTQPKGATNYYGDTATLSLVAGGDEPLSVQWYYPDLNTPLVNGSSGYGSGTISGATSQTLTLTFVDTNQAGNYQVIVGNSLNTVTSVVAHLTVNVRPVIATNIAYLHTLHNTNYVLTDATNLYQIDGIVTTPGNLVQPLPAQSFFVQDSSGAGIDVFFRDGFPFPSAGDRVKVTAPLLQFNGVLEAAPVNGNPAHSIEIVNSGNPLPAPRLFDFSTLPTANQWEGYTNGSSIVPAWEGSLVVVSNVYLNLTNANGLMVAGGPIFMTNLTGQVFTLLVPNNSLLDPVGYPLPATYASSVQGVISQSQTSGTVLTNGYSIMLTLRSDIVPGTPPILPIPLVTGYTAGTLTLSWSDPAFILQSSTNVAGPYVDVPGAFSPFATNAAMSDVPAQFFRLYRTP